MKVTKFWLWDLFKAEICMKGRNNGLPEMSANGFT